MTFGDINSFGGILIRAIQNIKTKEIITGIGKITNQILDDIGGAKKITKIYNDNLSVFSENSVICLRPSKKKAYEIYRKQRIGLNHKQVDTDNFFLNAKYNYFTHPSIEKVK